MKDRPTTDSALAIERRTIDVIPDGERHGTPRNQFTLWFGANMQITAIVDGALAVVFGADAIWAIVGLLIGNVLGGVVMALHSAQGPRLGLPQMISSRAQFGVYGAVVPLLLVVLMYLGFAATGTVLAGQAIGQILHIRESGRRHRRLRGADRSRGGDRVPTDSRHRKDRLRRRHHRLQLPGDPALHRVRRRVARRGEGIRLRHLPARHFTRCGLAADIRTVRRGLLALSAAQYQRSRHLLVHAGRQRHRLLVVHDVRRSRSRRRRRCLPRRSGRIHRRPGRSRAGRRC